MKNTFPRFFAYLSVCVLVACTNRPFHVLPEKKMEDILFDLYIAETEIKENTILYNDSLKRELLQSVFKKHKISEQKFDTSLVWYNAHLEKYMKINDKLTERYTVLINTLQAETPLIRKPENRLQFSDLGLKDFVTPVLPSFQMIETDTIPKDTLPKDTIRKTVKIPLVKSLDKLKNHQTPKM